MIDNTFTFLSKSFMRIGKKAEIKIRTLSRNKHWIYDALF